MSTPVSDVPVSGDEYYLDAPTLRAFIATVQTTVATALDHAETVRRLRPAFSTFLADHSWLPATFQEPATAGGMGAGIANYLIYRSADGGLSLSALVLAPGASTPVHDHLAWGLVGLYTGSQDEWVYRRVDNTQDESHAELVADDPRHLSTGDFYELLPPAGDIHSVTATSSTPSVSLHLLGNDIGCIWRHRFDPHTATVQPFRSSYTNKPCPPE